MFITPESMRRLRIAGMILVALGLITWIPEDFRHATGPLLLVGAFLYVGGRA